MTPPRESPRPPASPRQLYDFDGLKRRLDAVKIIGMYVPLKRSGSQWVGCCPFHADSTPSFSVSQHGYCCHGCDAKGDVIRFVEEIEQVNPIDAYKRLASDAGFTPGAIAAVTRERVAKQQAVSKPSETSLGTLVRTYDYTDERGVTLYQVCRYDPKDFRQRRPDGKGGWDWSLNGARLVLYRLPDVLKAETVHLCAGEKDADNLREMGLVATTNAGGEKKWDASFTKALAGRNIVLWVDNDRAGIQRETRLLRELAPGAKSLRPVRTPYGKDVSDWIQHGATAELIAGHVRRSPDYARQSFAAAGAMSEQKVPANEIGRAILARHTIMSGQQGYVWEYTGTHWRLVDNGALEAYAHQIDTVEHTSRRRCSEAASFVVRESYNPNLTWNRLEPYEIAFANGVLNLRLDNLMRDHRHEDNLEAVTPHTFPGSQACPNWVAALERYFRGDPDSAEKIIALQEFFGYCLMPHARYKKCLMLEGESNCGKSQILTAIEILVGSEYVCSILPGLMDDARNLEPILGKRANIVHDLPSNTVIADGGFKSLIDTEHSITVRPMYKSPMQYRPIAKHIFGCNRRPRVNDLTGGVYNRILYLKFNNVIPAAEQDPFFADKLLSESEGIVWWAVLGAARLLERNGRFTEPQSSREELAAYREEQNPIGGFIEMHCEIPPADLDPEQARRTYAASFTEFRRLYEAYRKQNISPQSLGMQLRAAGFLSEKPKGGEFRDQRIIFGLKLKNQKAPDTPQEHPADWV